MVFCSPVFLFLFLPLVLAGYYLLPRGARNAFLLAASLVFYAWGEGGYTAVLLGLMGGNYAFGLWIEARRGKRGMKAVLGLAVAVNLLALGGYKYLNFAAGMLNPLLAAGHLGRLAVGPVHQPLGISFFTFHGLSYVVDVYRGEARAETSWGRVALYVALFPQLIAGPILRYHQVAAQFVSRTVNLELLQSGLRRFLIGFAKKMLLANTLAIPADQMFGASPRSLSAGAAWLGAVCYTFQIYFDFSGYSDMAIGLGRMFGFHFPENFNYPYISRSIQEYWRRWHLSLSTWLRDYLYIPLGGNRVAPARHRANLLAVFFLCGLWHGANWTFVVWGLYHGLFVVLEKGCLARGLARLPGWAAHGYAMLVLTLGYVIFRADSLPHATRFFRAMLGVHGEVEFTAAMGLSPDVALALAAAVVGSTPLPAALVRRWLAASGSAWIRQGAELMLNAGLLALFGAGLALLAAGTYNPFIYFRF